MIWNRAFVHRTNWAFLFLVPKGIILNNRLSSCSLGLLRKLETRELFKLKSCRMAFPPWWKCVSFNRFRPVERSVIYAKLWKSYSMFNLDCEYRFQLCPIQHYVQISDPRPKSIFTQLVSFSQSSDAKITLNLVSNRFSSLVLLQNFTKSINESLKVRPVLWFWQITWPEKTRLLFACSA